MLKVVSGLIVATSTVGAYLTYKNAEQKFVNIDVKRDANDKILRAKQLLKTNYLLGDPFSRKYIIWKSRENVTNEKFMEIVNYESRHPIAKYIYHLLCPSKNFLKYEIATPLVEIDGMDAIERNW